MLEINQKNLLSILKDLLPDDPIIIEAGAFTGKDSIRLAQTWPQGTVYAFEPDPAIYTQLQKNIHAYSNIHPFEQALGNKNGRATFWPSEHPKKPGTPSQAGSLLQPKERLTWSNITFKEPITIQTITLASWAQQQHIDHIDLLWLDLQGYELPVMQASRECIGKVPYILTEVHFVEAYAGQAQYPQVKAWLEQEGFTMIGKDFADEPNWFFGNALFSHRLA